MMGAIRYNLRNLATFQGRDARQTFWYYILFLVIVNFAISSLSSIPMMGGIASRAAGAAMSGADENAATAAMMHDMAGTMVTVAWIGIGVSIAMIFLFVAAFVRRLHDSGHSGKWAAIPVLTQIASIVVGIRMIGAMREVFMSAAGNGSAMDIGAVQQYGLLGLVGWIGYIVVIVFGVMPSQDGPNAYADAPVRF